MVLNKSLQVYWRVGVGWLDEVKLDTVKLWNITSGQLIRTLIKHTSYIQWSLDLLNSQTLILGSMHKIMELVDG